jgi:hypothetical protein
MSLLLCNIQVQTDVKFIRLLKITTITETCYGNVIIKMKSCSLGSLIKKVTLPDVTVPANYSVRADIAEGAL